MNPGRAGSPADIIRALSIDPTDRMVVVTNLIQLPGAPERISTQLAMLSAYKIGDDDRLTFVRSYDIETNQLLQILGVCGRRRRFCITVVSSGPKVLLV